MPIPAFAFRSSLVSLGFLTGLVGMVLGQGRGKSDTTHATIVGRVIDTVGTPLEGAEVVATLTISRDSSVVRTATSDRRGNVVFTNLAAGGPYTLVARKIGFGAARGTDIHLKGGDTLRVDFELPATGVTLPTITVTSHRGARFAIASDEIDAHKYPDALELIAWKRPYMLGDPDQCSPPLPPPWPVPQNKGFGRRPWLEGARFFDVFNPPYSPYVQRIYVNGQRIDRPGESPLIALHDVPSSQIAEMRYIDCMQVTDLWPYSIYIVLKSPSREVQDSIWRAITRGAAQP